VSGEFKVHKRTKVLRQEKAEEGMEQQEHQQAWSRGTKQRVRGR
jgi:hypothetical protein